MNRVAHFEIGVNDPEPAVAFPTEVFGRGTRPWEGTADLPARHCRVESFDEYTRKVEVAGVRCLFLRWRFAEWVAAPAARFPEGMKFRFHQPDSSAKAEA